MYVTTDTSGRILATSEYAEYLPEEAFEFEFPDDFDFTVQNDYRVVDGELVSDPVPVPPEVQLAELKQKLAQTDYIIVKVQEYAISEEALSDEDANRYADVIAQRKQWRQQINELESTLSE